MAGYGVSTATGNFTLTAFDLVLADGYLGWARTYNALDDTAGIMGRGWTPALAAHLVPGQPGGGAPVMLFADDGRQLPFTPDGHGGFTRPADLDADLMQNTDGSFTLTFLSGETWQFDASGRLVSQGVPGIQVTFGYDAQGRLTTASSSAGGRLTLGYDGSGRLTTVESGDGRAVSYSYADDGSLNAATTPSGTTRYDAASGGLIGRVTGPDGNPVVTSTYDAQGRVQHQDYPSGGADFGYDDATGTTTVTRVPSGAAVTYDHDPNGRVVRLVDPAGNAVTFGFDDAGHLVSASGPAGLTVARTLDSAGNVLSSSYAGATTTYRYDGANRVISTTDPDGAVTSYTYAGGDQVPASVTDPNGAVTQYTVADGLVTARTDPDGNTTAFGYDAARNLTTATSPLGAVTRYGYDQAGNRTSVTTPSGAVVTYAYDPAGNLTSVTDSAGNTTRYAYTAGGLLSSLTDPVGATTAYGYDAARNLTSVTDPLGRITGFGFDAIGNPVAVTDPAGNVTNSEYNQLGQQTSVTDPAGVSTTYGYDALGRQISVQTPAGTTATGYDVQGNLVSITDPDGSAVRYDYDVAGRQTAITWPDGGTQRVSYDSAGNVTAVTSPLGAQTRYQWTPASKRAAVTDPLGRVTSYGYDAEGKLTTRTDPEGGVTRYTYDADGRITSVTTPAGLVTTYRYDAAGRVIAVTNPRGWITRYEYDARGRRTGVIQASGATRRLSYDSAGQLTETTDANGSITRYSYDNAGHLTAITDAKGAVTRFGYDAAGRETSSTDPLGRTTTRAYDSSGRLAAVTDPAGQSLRLEYDAAGRISSRTAANAAVSYTYDSAGRRASMTDGTGTTRYAYDASGRVTSVTGPDGGVLSAGYDAAGQRTSLTYPDGLQVGYSYDLNGRLTGMHDPRAGDAVYALDPDGRLLTEQLPGRLARRYHYDRDVLHHFGVVRDGHPVAQTELTRDPDGRIIARSDGDMLRSYRYDPGGQLIFAALARPGATRDEEVRLGYDTVGNRTMLRRGATETRYRYDEADQLLAAQTGERTTEYRYDSAGRLTEEVSGDDRLVIGYDGFGLPVTRARTIAGRAERTESTFSGDGLLTQLVLSTAGDGGETESKASIRYQWSVTDKVPQILTQRAGTELDNTAHDHPGRLDADFSYGYGRTFASWAQGAAAFDRDVFGSARRTEDTEPWALAEDYDTFGEPAEPAQTARPDGAERAREPQLPRFGYRGELALGQELYLRARWYDTRTGRFTSTDPANILAGPSNVRNPYVYAANDPTDFVDPLGTLLAPAAPSMLPGGSAVIDTLLGVTAPPPPGCARCQNPGNSIQRHEKCFWNFCLSTRGYISQAALNADGGELNRLWNAHQPERAAQAFTLNHLDWNRAGWWSKTLSFLFGTPPPVNQNVDWEIAVPVPGPGPGNRQDILTETQHLYEVKRYTGPATTTNVTAQLTRYVNTVAAPPYNHRLTRGTELQDWADIFYVITGYSGWFNIFVHLSLVYVWGLNPPNPAGHVYFATSDKTPRNVQNQVAQQYMLNSTPIPAPTVKWYQIPQQQPLANGEVPSETGDPDPFEEPLEPAA